MIFQEPSTSIIQMESENVESIQIIVGKGIDGHVLVEGRAVSPSRFNLYHVLVFWLRNGYFYIDEDQLKGLNMRKHEAQKIKDSEKFQIWWTVLTKKWTGVLVSVALTSQELSKIPNLFKTKGKRVSSPILGLRKIERSLLEEYGVWSF